MRKVSNMIQKQLGPVDRKRLSALADSVLGSLAVVDGLKEDIKEENGSISQNLQEVRKLLGVAKAASTGEVLEQLRQKLKETEPKAEKPAKAEEKKA